MPPLASLSLNPVQPPSTQAYTSSNPATYYAQSPPAQPPPPQHQQPQPIRQSRPSPPAEAQIQSWADQVPQQQPRPMPPPAPVANMHGAWTPEMGIRFAGLPAAATGGGSANAREAATKGPVRGTWDPSSGIRFG